eukprot:TRINITY_DN25720_c0_g1_i1.p1 TRINITY_DN25720_c0_g1~~TRINITY_DN25720_c0_g1_i1.p1  ORF type:complete len:517 (+),score=92.54 TRINITY_DN25720_c0_g1_i1:67-1551(+)
MMPRMRIDLSFRRLSWLPACLCVALLEQRQQLRCGAGDICGHRDAAAAEEVIWEFGVKLVPLGGDDESTPKLGGADIMRLVVRAWLTCHWTRVYVVSEAGLKRLGMSQKQALEVRRCGPSIRHNCRFYDARSFERRTGVRAGSQSGSLVLGYFVDDSLWEIAPAAECASDAAFQPVDHPLRHLHPHGFTRWLAARLAENDLELSKEDEGSASALALAALPDMCVEDVASSGVWEQLWPGESDDAATARQLLVIGCGDLGGEPTDPLLERGAGGLFLDADRAAVRRARASERGSAPGRLVLNATVSPASLASLLRAHASFVRNVDVLQVDIDTMDGPVVMRALQLLRPQAVVVEVRNFLPLPFRYACLTTNTQQLPWGGASLGYWLRELSLRGFELIRMDARDAVFARRGLPGTEMDPRRRLLGALGCYLRNMLSEPSPALLLRDSYLRSDGDAEERWNWLWHHWMHAPAPEQAVAEIWRNLTSWRGDISFSLQL